MILPAVRDITRVASQSVKSKSTKKMKKTKNKMIAKNRIEYIKVFKIR